MGVKIYFQGGVVPVIADTFRKDGAHIISREQDGQPWPFEARYTHANDDAPVGVVLHGYRSDAIRSGTGRAFQRLLSGAGLSVLQLNYGGFDHYGQEQIVPQPDQATLGTNAADLSAVLDNLGGRKAVICLDSYSVNVAIPALNDNVAGVVACSPFPNFVQNRIHPIIEEYPRLKRTFERNGYVGYPFEGRRLKVSKCFVEHAMGAGETPGHDVFEALEWHSHRPPMSVIYRPQDKIVENPLLVANFIARAQGAGYDTHAVALEGDSHGASLDMVDAVKAALSRMVAPVR